MLKVLVLGGSGFLGQNIIELLEKSHAVISCDKYRPRFRNVEKNITEDPYQTKLELNFDTCIHLIDHKVQLIDFQNYEQKLANNLIWNTKKHLILMSSSVLYANPKSEYGRRKQLLEDFWQSFCHQRGIKLTILRLFNVYGPYQIPFVQGSLVANIIFNYLSNKTTDIYDMNARRTFVFAKDVARVFDYVIRNNLYGSHDICGSNDKSIEELISLMESHVMKAKIPINNLNQPEKIFCPVGNHELLQKVTETDFIKAMQETYIFYLKNKNNIFPESFK